MKNKGFTLVEIIAVIALLALIATIIIVNTTGMQTNTIDLEIKKFKEKIERTACQYIDKGVDLSLATSTDCSNDPSMTTRDNCKYNSDGCYVCLKTLIDNGLIDQEDIDPITNKKLKEEFFDVRVRVKWVNDNGVKKKVCEYEGEDESSPIIVYVNKWKITFNYNGGSGTEASREVEEDHVIGELPTGTKSGYYIDYWYYSGNESRHAYQSDKMGKSDITLIAHWSPSSRTLTYDSDGGSECSPKTKTGTYDSTWGTLCEPSRSGYLFGGWFTAKNGGGSPVTKDTKVVDNITVYAKWTTQESCTYSHYDNNTTKKWLGTYTCIGSTGTLTGCEYSYGTRNYVCYGGSQNVSSTYMCTLSNKTKEKLYDKCNSEKFGKSTTSYGGGMATSESCSCEKVTVTFNLNGYSGTTPSPVTLVHGSALGRDKMPKLSSLNITNDTLVFDGWYTERTGGTKLFFYTQITKNQTYYARFRKAQLSYYIAELGSNTGLTSGCENQVVEKNKGEKWGTLCKPKSNTGYSSKYWYSNYETQTGSVSASDRVTQNTDVTGDENVYVIYLKNLKLTFNSQGGSSCSDITKAYGSKWGTLCEPTKNGYKFSGWYTETNGNGEKIDSTTVADRDLTVYAYYTNKSTYTLYLDYQGGAGVYDQPGNPSVRTITAYEGESWSGIPNPVRDCYACSGWYTDDGVLIKNGTLATSDLTVRARWVIPEGWWEQYPYCNYM